MQAPSELAVTHSLSLLFILMQLTAALCSFMVSMSWYEFWNNSQSLTFSTEKETFRKDSIALISSEFMKVLVLCAYWSSCGLSTHIL